jgi:Phosphotransferase enzyme family
VTTIDTSHQAALDWAEAQLGGPVQVEPMKVRPWAATWRLSTADRVGYLKTTAVSTRYEVPLMAILGRAVPSWTPAVLATEPDQGWLLLADAGTPLREQLNGRFDARAWQTMLPRFGLLQRAAEPFAVELLAAGVPDERPHRYLELLEPLLAKAPGLTVGQRRSLLGEPDRWHDVAAALGELDLPASIQHGDLHDANVALGLDALPRFFDFGDASLAHPFTTLLVPLRVARSHGADDHDVELLRESYLDVFTDLAGRAELRRALDLALATAPLLRATSWQRALIEAPADHDWGDPVGGWLEELPAGADNAEPQ